MTESWATQALSAYRRTQAAARVRRAIVAGVRPNLASEVFEDQEARIERMLRAVLTAGRAAASPKLSGTEPPDPLKRIGDALDWAGGRWASDQVTALRRAWEAARKALEVEDADRLVAVEAYAGWLRDLRQAARAKAQQRRGRQAASEVTGGAGP
jgi:hypothetical protein